MVPKKDNPHEGIMGRVPGHPKALPRFYVKLRTIVFTRPNIRQSFPYFRVRKKSCGPWSLGSFTVPTFARSSLTNFRSANIKYVRVHTTHKYIHIKATFQT